MFYNIVSSVCLAFLLLWLPSPLTTLKTKCSNTSVSITMYESSCGLAEVNRVGICTSCKVDNKIVDQLLVKTIHTINDELEESFRIRQLYLLLG